MSNSEELKRLEEENRLHNLKTTGLKILTTYAIPFQLSILIVDFWYYRDLFFYSFFLRVLSCLIGVLFIRKLGKTNKLFETQLILSIIFQSFFFSSHLIIFFTGLETYYFIAVIQGILLLNIVFPFSWKFYWINLILLLFPYLIIMPIYNKEVINLSSKYFECFYGVIGCVTISSFNKKFFEKYSNIVILRKLQFKRQVEKVGEMTFRTVHDLRNTLAVLKMTIEELKGDDNIKKIAEEGVERIEKTISGILFDRLESESVNLNLSLFFEELLAELEIRFKGIDVAITVEGNDHLAGILYRINQTELYNSMLNVIQNSIESMMGISHKKLKVKFLKNKNFLNVLVFDNGIGIKNVDTSKIFESFYTSGKESGSGVGLYQVKEMAKKYSIDISINSLIREDYSTVFEFSFPLD